jgi:hypothetical protein
MFALDVLGSNGIGIFNSPLQSVLTQTITVPPPGKQYSQVIHGSRQYTPCAGLLQSLIEVRCCSLPMMSEFTCGKVQRHGSCTLSACRLPAVAQADRAM